MLETILESWQGREVTAFDVYADIFHLGEGYIQRRGEFNGSYKANPLAYYKNEVEEHGHYRILFEDTFEEDLKECQPADFCILNGITYFGRKNVLLHASKMFAMIFDLDGVTDKKLNSFLSGAFHDAYPTPNYIILSGHGVHLYYLFEEPIPLFPNLKIQLKSLKYALIDKIWNGYTSTIQKPQKQGINQGFRIIGGKTKKGATESEVRAFQINSHPFNLRQLCEYVPEEFRVDEKKLFRESKMTLEEAKKKYPDWYEQVVLKKEYRRSRWQIEKKVHGDDPYALYHWWLKQIKGGATYGHRYFCIMCLAIYAIKCNLPFEQLSKDAYGLVPFLNSLNPDEPFTDSDVESALECYDLKYCTFPTKDIESISGIQIKRNKRNEQKQADHLEEIRLIRDLRMKRQGRKWTDGNGRPSKEKIVRKFLEEHPDYSIAGAARALEVDWNTVNKYKKKMKNEEKN